MTHSSEKVKGIKAHLCRAQKMSSVNGDHLPVLPLSILSRRRGKKGGCENNLREHVMQQTTPQHSGDIFRITQDKHKKKLLEAKPSSEGPTHSQLLLEALDLRLERVDVLRLPLVGHVAGVGQLRQAVQSLLQSLHVRQQLRDLGVWTRSGL